MEEDRTACGVCCTHAGEFVADAAETAVPRHLTRSVHDRMGFATYEADDGTRVMARRGCNGCAITALRDEVAGAGFLRLRRGRRGQRSHHGTCAYHGRRQR